MASTTKRRFLTGWVILIGVLAGAYWWANGSPFESDDEIGIRVCEEMTKGKLRSPLSYQRARALVESYSPGSTHRTVWLDYDASNAFGTMVRGEASCGLRVDKDGKFGYFETALMQAKNEETAKELGIKLR